MPLYVGSKVVCPIGSFQLGCCGNRQPYHLEACTQSMLALVVRLNMKTVHRLSQQQTKWVVLKPQSWGCLHTYSVALILRQHCHAADVSRAEDLAKAEELAMEPARVVD